LNKINCWEFKKCGREPDGEKAHELGVCPASVESRLDGTHGGRNGGRACWVVPGSLCGGVIQGSYSAKRKDCKSCDFFQAVETDETVKELAINLLSKIRESIWTPYKERKSEMWM
jgi:hypothetical protein